MLLLRCHLYARYLQLHTQKTHTVSLRYIMLQPQYSYNICYMQCYFPQQTFCTLHQHFQQQCAVSSVTVFCSSFMSSIPGTFTYFVNNSEMFPSVPNMTGNTSVSTLHVRYMSTVRFLYFGFFSFSFIEFIFPEISVSLNWHVSVSLQRVVMSGLLLRMVLSVLSVSTCWFHNMVT